MLKICWNYICIAEPYWEATRYSINLLKLMKFPNIDKCVDNLLNGIELEAILYKYIRIYHYKIKRYNTSREGKC